MNYIIAVIAPHRLDDVRNALEALELHGMTVSDVRGFGRQSSRRAVYRGAEYSVDFVPMLKIEIAVSSEMARDAVSAICDAAHAGAAGDGRIFVLDLLDAVRVRTYETGADAL